MTDSDAYAVDWNDGNQEIAETVMWAAAEGKPLVVTTATGRKVRLAPEAAPVTEPDKPADTPPAAFDVEDRAREHTAILSLGFTPHLSKGADQAIAPYGVRITYRRETGSESHTWHTVVSGYRVLPSGVIDMSSGSIGLWSQADRDVTPDWLMGLIEDYAPTW